MRTKFVATILLVAGAIFFSSCNWFKSHSSQPAFKLQGKWAVDSLDSGNDSAVIGILAIASLRKDSLPLAIDFREDSTYVEVPENSNGKGKYYLKEKQLFLSEDSTYVPYELNVVSDSVIHLSGKDSLFIALKRQ